MRTGSAVEMRARAMSRRFAPEDDAMLHGVLQLCAGIYGGDPEGAPIIEMLGRRPIRPLIPGDFYYGANEAVNIPEMEMILLDPRMLRPRTYLRQVRGVHLLMHEGEHALKDTGLEGAHDSVPVLREVYRREVRNYTNDGPRLARLRDWPGHADHDEWSRERLPGAFEHMERRRADLQLLYGVMHRLAELVAFFHRPDLNLPAYPAALLLHQNEVMHFLLKAIGNLKAHWRFVLIGVRYYRELSQGIDPGLRDEAGAAIRDVERMLADCVASFAGRVEGWQ